MFCAKMRPLNDKFVAIFGMYRFVIFSLDTLQIVKGGEAEIPTMIEYAEARSNYLSVLTSDEEGENKLLYFWRFNEEGKIEETYDPFDVTLPEFEECSEDRL